MNIDFLLFLVISFLILTVAVFSLLYKKKYDNHVLYYVDNTWILIGIITGIFLGILVGLIIGNLIIGSTICLVICILLGVILQSKYGKKLKLNLDEINQRLLLAKIILIISIILIILLIILLIYY
jgi:hypothetical protein